ADDGDADRARVLELVLDAVADLAGEGARALVVGELRVDDHADFAAGLDRVGRADAVEGGGDGLERPEAVDVGGHGLGARAGTDGGDGVREADHARVERARRDFLAVGGDGVDDDVVLAARLDELRADAGVAAFVLAVDRLADVVEQARALGDVGVEAELGGDDRAEEADLDGVLEDVLRIGGAELELAQEGDDLRVQARDLELAHGGVARALDDLADVG